MSKQHWKSGSLPPTEEWAPVSRRGNFSLRASKPEEHSERLSAGEQEWIDTVLQDHIADQRAIGSWPTDSAWPARRYISPSSVDVQLIKPKQ